MSALAETLLEKLKSRRARTGVVGLGYVGLPLAVELAKAGFHATGIDLDARKVQSVNDGRSYIPDVSDRRRPGAPRAGQARRHDRLRRRQGSRHHQHLRADAAAQDEGPRHVLHRLGGGGHREVPPSRHADRAGVDNLSRNDRRSRAADAGSDRPEGRRRLLPRVLAGARRSGQPDVPDAQRAESRRRLHAHVRGSSPKELYGIRHRDHRAGQLDARRGDGQAAREHVPRGQHRPGERARADVRPDEHRRVGGGRRGQDQAVRVHGVLSRARPRRPLHPDRSVLPVVEGEADRVSIRGSSSWPVTSTPACRTTWSTRSARR